MAKKTPELEELTEVPGWNGKFFLGPNHTYWWVTGDKAPGGPYLAALSGITSVLGVIAKPALIQWSANMAVDYVKVHAQKIDDSMVHGKPLYTIRHDTLEVARTAHAQRKDAAAGLGHDAHALVEQYIKWCIENNEGIPTPQVTSAEPRVAEFAQWAMNRHAETRLTFIASETPLGDPKLAIAGTPDFIAEELYNGEMHPLIGDLKTGIGVYDRTFFAQMAAYGYMWMKRNKTKVAPHLLVVHMPAQKPGQLLNTYVSEDFKGDWEGFQSALYLHRWKDNFVGKPQWKK